ncbi:MAG: hypothetical protein OEZ65_14530 [Gemmatimonadota bacterium]|nr:hypothetical protein [Gemmatimonadota bacterium]MDH5760801.1 hypothetical protein [Gemmatimonadota bacterium]
MPSETVSGGRAAQALEAMSASVESFHSVVATAEEELRTYSAHRRGVSEFRGEQALMELGPFSVGRIDPEKFADLLGEADALSPEAIHAVERAEAILVAFAGSDKDLHCVTVVRGGDLRDAVKGALTEVGQIFGASRAVEMARAGIYRPDEHNHLLGSLPFRQWNRAERHLAPPLVVEVEADDLVPAGLGEFLDGEVKVVLVVSGITAPAPLARLITPGTFVMQTADPAALARMAASPHPGVALLFDEERDGQARFTHDPDQGDTPWKRITVEHLPEQPMVGRGRRDPTWLEELAHLKTLAAPPSVSAGAVAGEGAEPAAEPVEPADRLAAWLLSQTDLGEG